MDKQTLKATIIDIVSNCLGIPAAKIKVTAHLAKDLGADSVDAINLQWEIQNRLGVRLQEEHFQQIKTVRDLITVCEKQLT